MIRHKASGALRGVQRAGCYSPGPATPRRGVQSRRVVCATPRPPFTFNLVSTWFSRLASRPATRARRRGPVVYGFSPFTRSHSQQTERDPAILFIFLFFLHFFFVSSFKSQPVEHRWPFQQRRIVAPPEPHDFSWNTGILNQFRKNCIVDSADREILRWTITRRESLTSRSAG